MTDALFEAVWSQATEFRRAADRAHYEAAARRNRAGYNGPFAQAVQFDMDGNLADRKRALARLITRIES